MLLLCAETVKLVYIHATKCTRCLRALRGFSTQRIRVLRHLDKCQQSSGLLCRSRHVIRWFSRWSIGFPRPQPFSQSAQSIRARQIAVKPRPHRIRRRNATQRKTAHDARGDARRARCLACCKRILLMYARYAYVGTGVAEPFAV